MNITELKKQQEELAQLVKAAELSRKQEMDEAKKTLKPLYRYEVAKRTSKFDSLANAVGAIVITATRTDTPESLAYEAKFGERISTVWGSHDEVQHSVWYAYFNGQIHRGGGGYLMLSVSPHNWASDEPMDATQEEWDSILANKIPDRLLHSKYCTYQPAL